MDSPRDEPLTRLQTEGVGGRLRRHTSELLRLAAPIVVSRSGFFMLIMADVVMTGRLSTPEELAYLTISFVIVVPMVVTSLGLIMGTLVLTANKFGAGLFADCGPVWRRSVRYAFVLGLIGVAIGFNGETILLLTGQDADVAKRGGEIIFVISLGIPGQLVFLASTYFMEGIGRPLPVMVLMIFANALNIGLNWVLIDGMLTGDPLGAIGAAWATTAARTAMGVALVLYVWFLRDRDAFAIRAPLAGGFASWAELRRIGYAIGLSIGVESIAFATMNVFAGWLGKIPLAAYGLTINVTALVFMLAIGTGAATSVRVGIAHGRGDAPDTALAGWTGFGLNTLLMAAAAVMVTLFTEPIVRFYSDDPALFGEALLTVAFIAWVFVPDGGQALMANALRGRKDVWMPSLIQIGSFFVVMVPTGYFSALVLENGAVGLFHGILAGTAVSLACLGARFHWLALRDIRDMRRENPSRA